MPLKEILSKMAKSPVTLSEIYRPTTVLVCRQLKSQKIGKQSRHVILATIDKNHI